MQFRLRSNITVGGLKECANFRCCYLSLPLQYQSNSSWYLAGSWSGVQHSTHGSWIINKIKYIILFCFILWLTNAAAAAAGLWWWLVMQQDPIGWCKRKCRSKIHERVILVLLLLFMVLMHLCPHLGLSNDHDQEWWRIEDDNDHGGWSCTIDWKMIQRMQRKVCGVCRVYSYCTSNSMWCKLQAMAYGNDKELKLALAFMLE